MKDFFVYDITNKFESFSMAHFLTLGIIFISWILCILILRRIKGEHKYFRFVFAALLVSLELSNTLWRAATGHFSIADSLPLHLCGISSFTCAAMLITKNNTLFEFNYFMGIGGAIQALATPDLLHAFPHFDFFQHFLTHGLIILSVLYMIFIEGYWLKWTASVKIFIISNIYMIIIYGFNYLAGSNYLFINYPPPGPTLIDLLVEIFGPHPRYIIGMELIAIITYIILLIPVFIRNKHNRNAVI